MNTRASNKTSHPGDIDKPPPPCPSEIVQAERQEHAAAKAQKEQRRQDAIASLAAFENAAAKAHDDAQSEGHNPPTTAYSLRQRGRGTHKTHALGGNGEF